MDRQVTTTFSNNEAGSAAKKMSFGRLFWRVMRPHQWSKNLFIFAPLLFGKKITELTAIGHSLTAFACFCLLASGLYIFNDWLDAEEDRSHPEKCRRPICSGELPVPIALFGAAVLMIAAFGIAAALGFKFLLVAALYFILIVSYCLVLKRLMVLDCMTIAAGFVVRVVGGAVAVEVMPTHWLIVCAFLLALFLAFTKRRQELLTLSNNAADHRPVLGQYSVRYIDQVNNILIGAAIVCYALYTVAPETVQRFNTSNLIYGTVFVIYGMLRYMALIENSANGGNPSKMLLQDKPLMLTIAGWAIYNTILIYQTALSELWLSLFG